MISAEGPPLQRAGALIDVMDALPSALRARGHEVSVALPYYREIRENRAFKKKDTGITVEVQLGDTTHVARYLESRSASGVQLFFIRCDEFFDRAGIGPTIDAAIADSARARLGRGVGAGFRACTWTAFQHGFDHPPRC